MSGDGPDHLGFWFKTTQMAAIFFAVAAFMGRGKDAPLVWSAPDPRGHNMTFEYLGPSLALLKV